MRVVTLDRTSTAKGFCFFNFRFKYLKKLWSAEPPHTKMPLIILLIRHTVCMYTNRNLFRQTGLQKCGKVNNCSLDYGLWEEYLKKLLTSRNPNQNSGTIFSSNKSAPANRKHYTDRVPKKQRLEAFLYEAFQNFGFKIKIKKSKTSSGWCPF